MLNCFNICYNSAFDIILGGLFDYIFFFYKSSFSNKILIYATPTFILANLIALFYFCYIQIILFNFFVPTMAFNVFLVYYVEMINREKNYIINCFL